MLSRKPNNTSPTNEPSSYKEWVSNEFWVFVSPGIVVTLIGFFLAISFVGAPPPKTLRFASGSSWGAYNKFAQMYKEELKDQGLNIEVLETHGSTENLRLLTEGKADIAFVQGGVKPETDEVELVSLTNKITWVVFEAIIGGDTKITVLLSQSFVFKSVCSLF